MPPFILSKLIFLCTGVPVKVLVSECIQHNKGKIIYINSITIIMMTSYWQYLF